MQQGLKQLGDDKTVLRSRSRRGFTLIELMAVILLIAILMAIGIPAFRGIGRGSKMDAALNSIRTTISLARQWAVTHRENTYFLMASQNPKDPDYPYTSDILAERLPYRSYAVYGEKSGFIKGWTYLPEGILFNPDFDDKNQNPLADDAPRFGVTNVFDSGQEHVTKAAALIFGMRGSVQNAGAVAEKFIPLKEGTTLLDNKIEDTYEMTTNSLVAVNGLTGVAQIRRSAGEL